MNISRRGMLLAGSSLLTTAVVHKFGSSVPSQDSARDHQFIGPTHSIIPIVGDGKWIWTEPPETDRGYLEQRTFDLTIEIHAKGSGYAKNLSAFTASPVAFPEQEIADFAIETKGCKAEVQPLTHSAARLFMAAESIEQGQVISAIARYRLKISKSYFGYDKEAFPAKQKLRRKTVGEFLGNGPGIQTSSKEVREVVKTVAGNLLHPWDIAKAYHQWVWDNIKGQAQEYTNVVTAIRKKVGDCEERAAVFVALCRASGIPARLVWVPNHNWAEILLTDEEGKYHWIPCHTSAYSWFGWTGVHELLLQKGDRVPLPGKRPVRLIYDHIRYVGKQPEMFFTANLNPVAEGEEDAGPGQRQKQKTGEWKLIGENSQQKHMRV